MQDKRIINELKRIEKENGVLRASDVVRAARPASSPLHGEFEWDDTAAAEKYRIDQARALIRVCVEFVGVPKRKTSVFVSLTPDRTNPGGGYRSMTKVLAMDEMRSQLLQDALADMEVFVSRYNGIAELAKVGEAMAKAAREIRHQTGKRVTRKTG